MEHFLLELIPKHLVHRKSIRKDGTAKEIHDKGDGAQKRRRKHLSKMCTAMFKERIAGRTAKSECDE